ncbi:hypothetical protein NDU88_005460 [Pleurodeles waltl]|uniref:Uncharacterized protein n=1 Tax=Pleurodeles waltl TaxID=8319 RepID=A0AAV7SLY0_PLEWA|nr:hypothetical protein NDU88_005460 [Pleurodeles waltl]
MLWIPGTGLGQCCGASALRPQQALTCLAVPDAPSRSRQFRRWVRTSHPSRQPHFSADGRSSRLDLMFTHCAHRGPPFCQPGTSRGPDRPRFLIRPFYPPHDQRLLRGLHHSLQGVSGECRGSGRQDKCTMGGGRRELRFTRAAPSASAHASLECRLNK